MNIMIEMNQITSGFGSSLSLLLTPLIITLEIFDSAATTILPLLWGLRPLWWSHSFLLFSKGGWLTTKLVNNQAEWITIDQEAGFSSNSPSLASKHSLTDETVEDTLPPRLPILLNIHYWVLESLFMYILSISSLLRSHISVNYRILVTKIVQNCAGSEILSF